VQPPRDAGNIGPASKQPKLPLLGFLAQDPRIEQAEDVGVDAVAAERLDEVEVQTLRAAGIEVGQDYKNASVFHTGARRARLDCDATAVRLNAYLARAGVASRRKADDLIKAGRVTVNGRAGQLNTFVEPADRVEVDGSPVAPQQLAYVLLHKPAGVVTTANDPQGRLTVVDLVRHDSRVVPIGRLDADTTGVLLLTNDGDLAHRLAHPKYEVEKVYEAEVEGEPGDDALRRLADGVELEDGRTAPAKVRRLGPSRVELAIHEGRNRQVRRMLEAVGHPVRRLHRSRYAGLTTEGLQPGESRELTGDEVAELRSGG
jgi:23S rRNA pseudouridine2605 synthase